MILVKRLVLCLLVIVGTLGKVMGLFFSVDSYSILFWSSMFFFLFSVICTLSIHFFLQKDGAPFLKYWKHFAIIGGLEALNGFLVIYTSQQSRTTQFFRGVIGSSVIFYSIPATEFLIPSTRRQYCQLHPILALGLISAGVVLSAFLTLFHVREGKVERIAWEYTFFVGMIALVIANVLQERYLKERAKVPYSYEWFDISIMLLLSSMFQFIFVVLGFGLDFTPVFGNSCNIQNFADNQRRAIQEVFSSNPIPFFIFLFGYIIATSAQSALNQESATFAFMMVASASPLAAFIWVIMKKIESLHIFEILSFFLILFGSFVWKYWEDSLERTTVVESG